MMSKPQWALLQCHYIMDVASKQLLGLLFKGKSVKVLIFFWLMVPGLRDRLVDDGAKIAEEARGTFCAAAGR